MGRGSPGAAAAQQACVRAGRPDLTASPSNPRALPIPPQKARTVAEPIIATVALMAEPGLPRPSPHAPLLPRLPTLPPLQARTVAEPIIATVALMAESGLPCFSRGAPVANLRGRFHLEMSDAQAAAWMRAQVQDAYDKWTTGFYDYIQVGGLDLWMGGRWGDGKTGGREMGGGRGVCSLGCARATRPLKAASPPARPRSRCKTRSPTERAPCREGAAPRRRPRTPRAPTAAGRAAPPGVPGPRFGPAR
jgi:hypothetical protein